MVQPQGSLAKQKSVRTVPYVGDTAETLPVTLADRSNVAVDLKLKLFVTLIAQGNLGSKGVLHWLQAVLPTYLGRYGSGGTCSLLTN